MHERFPSVILYATGSISTFTIMDLLSLLTISVSISISSQEVPLRKDVYLNERIFDTHRGTFFPAESYRLAHNKMLDQRVVCVGEVHNDNFHHRAELEILKVDTTHILIRNKGYTTA